MFKNAKSDFSPNHLPLALLTSSGKYHKNTRFTNKNTLKFGKNLPIYVCISNLKQRFENVIAYAK